MQKQVQNIKTEEIKFYEDKLLGGIDSEGTVWLAVNKTCQSLGFDENDSENQAKKIRKDDVLSELSVKFYGQVESDNGTIQNREMTFLSEKAITLWLAKINITKNMKEKYPLLSEKLIKYQLECSEVLHNHFMGNQEKKETFFNDTLGVDIKSIQEQNILLIEQNNKLNIQVENLTFEFEEFRNFTENQTTALNMLIGRFAIYDEPSIKYTRLVDDFNAKVQGAINERNKHFIFWEGVSDWFGLNFDELLQCKNKKQELLNKLGIDKLEYFVNNVILNRIIKNDKGHWINLQGFNSDLFGIEKKKILSHWTTKKGKVVCCYCENEIKNPTENVNFNYEHMIAKTQSGSTNTIENISIACCECNKEKNSSNYDEFINAKNTSSVFVERLNNWRESYKA